MTAVLIASALGLEVALRLVLFGPAPIRRVAPALRDPDLFADARFDQDYWTLTELLGPTGVNPFEFDPRLGWRSSRFGPDYEHQDEVHVGRRRPILLFGDSFANCLTSELECFEGLFANSPYTGSGAILNYGVAGYGLDQIALCVEAALPRWLERDPIVVVGIFVADDLFRCTLSMRTWPKPRYTLEGDALVLHPPAARTPDEWVAQHPPRIRSYLLRWIERRRGQLTDERRAQRRELEEIGRRIVLGLRDDLERQGLDYLFFLMPGEYDLRAPEPRDWPELHLLETFAAHDVPFESARGDLVADMAESGRPLGDYFERGHYNALGNRVAFRALLRGILRSHEADGEE